MPDMGLGTLISVDKLSIKQRIVVAARRLSGEDQRPGRGQARKGRGRA